MWLLVIEIIAAVVASARGWGGKPFAILGGSLVIGFFGGMLFGVDSISCLNIVDIIATIALVVMALVGNERPTPEGANTADTRPCPYCGERVKREAVICRFCGRDISGTALQNLPLPTTSNWQTGEPLSLPILYKFQSQLKQYCQYFQAVFSHYEKEKSPGWRHGK